MADQVEELVALDQQVARILHEAYPTFCNERSLTDASKSRWANATRQRVFEAGIRAALSHKGKEAPVREGWRPIETAPKDGTRLLIQLKCPIPRTGRPDLDVWGGIPFVARHQGLASDGFDVGWSFAAPVGQGGFPDEWIAGWMPLPPAPSTIPNPIQEQGSVGIAPAELPSRGLDQADREPANISLLLFDLAERGEIECEDNGIVAVTLAAEREIIRAVEGSQTRPASDGEGERPSGRKPTEPNPPQPSGEG